MISVIDANGNTQSIGTLPSLGLSTAANSLPTVSPGDSTSGTITSTNGTTVAAVIPTSTAVTGSAIEVSTQGYNTLAVQVTGVLTGVTLTIQGTIDNSTWVTVGTSRVHSFAATITATSTIVAAGIYYIDVTGLSKARIVSTALSAQSPLIPTGSSVVATMTLSSQLGIPSVLGAISTVSAVSVVTSANLGLPSIIADAASGAITTTTTSATITPTFGCSYEVNIPVTAVTGTSPTLDVVIQESDDSGTNWFDVYHFERITTTGIYRSPKMPLTGNRVRYVQTISGTTPSFTRSINRLQSSDTGVPIRRYFDRTLNSTQAINAVTSSYGMGNPSKNIQLIISSGTITTAPAFKVQGSEDGGTSWYDIPGAALTAAASSTVQVTVSGIRSPLIRAIVTTAGSGATLNYISIKVFE